MKNVSTFKTRATMNPVHKHDLSRVCAICLSDVRHLSIFIGACWIVRNLLTIWRPWKVQELLKAWRYFILYYQKHFRPNLFPSL
jgi:hypothetical protein